jgi:hypothetical protein
MRCSVCGREMIDDLEVAQGHCVTPPCWMYASGLTEEAEAWEREHSEFWPSVEAEGGGEDWLCSACGEPLDEDGCCPYCNDDYWPEDE